ncbi:ETX/MTX2 family pore-forming toxin [Priestia aryabhattai]
MTIFDLDVYLTELGNRVVSSYGSIYEVTSSQLSVKNAESYGLEIAQRKPLETMFIGESELTNDTDETQSINSDTFTKSITDSVTLSVTNGFTAGVSVSIGGKIFGMGAETSMSFEVSTSETREQTSEVSVAYTVPSQIVSVPPRSKRYVYAALERSQLEGSVRLKADLSGPVTLWVAQGSTALPFNTELYKFINENQSLYPLPSGISLNHNDKSIHFEGVADYYYGTGTKFRVTLTNTPSSQKNYEIKSYDSKTGTGTYNIKLNGKKDGFDFNDFKDTLDSETFNKLIELQKQSN